MQIRGSVALVTGGASGLGEGVARMLIEGGAKVGIVDLAHSRGAALAAELGGAARFIAADVSDPAAVESAVVALAAAFGRLDLCVTCAGVCPAARVVSRRKELFPLGLFRHTVDVNLVGTFDVVRHAARCMTGNEPNEHGERGLVVMTASIAGYEGQIGQSAYAASKGALIALTLPLARDLAQWGIRVLTICPGTMDTAMLAAFDGELRDSLVETAAFPRRPGTATEFAHLVRAMAENTYLNGEVVRLDAGTRLTAR